MSSTHRDYVMSLVQSLQTGGNKIWPIFFLEKLNKRCEFVQSFYLIYKWDVWLIPWFYTFWVSHSDSQIENEILKKNRRKATSPEIVQNQYLRGVLYNHTRNYIPKCGTFILSGVAVIKRTHIIHVYKRAKHKNPATFW